MCPVYEYKCSGCETHHDDFREYEARDNPGQCPDCGATTTRVFTPPNITRKSFVDGTRRFDHLRTQNKLDRARAEAKARGDKESEKKLKQEIRKLNK